MQSPLFIHTCSTAAVCIVKPRRAYNTSMEYRLLGGSGLKVSALAYGTATFGGTTGFFEAMGTTEVDEARRLIDICIDAGVNLFDTADGYADGRSEEVLGKALGAKRDKVLISTKSGFPTGSGPNDEGSSRYHLRRALEAAYAVSVQTTSTSTICTASTR